MKAFVTGASSGMGRDIAHVLAEKGYDLIIVARREERLLELAAELDTDITVIPCDLSNEQSCINLFEKIKDEDIDIAVNNAGFGAFGEFNSIDLTRELEMIDTNVRAVHILTKLFAEKFVRAQKGHILNVASSAGFFSGPLMSTYYATKAYVLRYSEAIAEELRRSGSPVKMSILCPGPVGTEFGSVANVAFSMKGLDSMDVARYAVKKMLAGKLVIVPSLMMKTAVFLRRFLSEKLLSRIVYNIQKQKCSSRDAF